MIPDEVAKYVRESEAAGQSKDVIRQGLQSAGWPPEIVSAALPPEKRTGLSPVIGAGALAIFVLTGAVAYLWQERFDLANTNNREVQAFYVRLAEAKVSFTDTGELVFPDEENFRTRKSEYIEQHADFIEVDLRRMELTLYKSGVAEQKFAVLSKGKERSWWETPTGDYKVLAKEANAYSSIGNVWMPYGLQFYGNYFIHGWPYYDDGTPVSANYSGGCIRLSTEDAQAVFAFAKKDMPVLVLEEYAGESVAELAPTQTLTPLPSIDAAAFIVANLATGEILVEKHGHNKLPIASLTKLMTGVVAHEVIYLGRSIKATPQVVAAVAQSLFYPDVGERYVGLDLLYPLLMQSSNETAKLLASYIGEKMFVQNMNAKAVSLEMSDTAFADPSGASAENVSTGEDLVKLLQYIYFKRPFLFDITRGVAFENVGLIKIGDTIDLTDLKNFNEFVGDPDLIGVKNGETTAAKQTLSTVWNIHASTGNVPVAIIVLGSEDRKKATESLIAWVRANYNAQNVERTSF